MKKLLFALINLTLCFSGYAQFASNPVSVSQMNTADSFNIRIYYALNAVDIKNPNTYDDFQRLEIGRHLSKYYSYFTFNNDSLVTEWLKKNPQPQGIPQRLGPGGKKGNWSEYVFSEHVKDFRQHTLTEYARMPALMDKFDSYCIDTSANQMWSIESDTLTVAGYSCQKATCNFRGRIYTAWFATDIPIGNGPWKFGGLPGLILKVYDMDKLYTFECVKIENLREGQPIKLYDRYKKYTRMDRLKLLKFQRGIHEDYFGMLNLDPAVRGRLPKATKGYQALELE